MKVKEFKELVRDTFETEEYGSYKWIKLRYCRYR